MGVRDVFFWASEAKRKVVNRQIEACNAALLPQQSPEDINKEMESLRVKATEIDQDVDEIAQWERENAELMAQAAVKAKAARARKKANVAAGVVGKPKKKSKIPANARRIR
jgi:cell shape-determining protein MreC